MSQDKGKRAARWVAAWMRPWFANVEALPGGRAGADLTGTPGVSFEIKTGVTWREAWMKQAAKYPGRIQVLLYLPPGVGERNVGSAQFIVPATVGMQLLEDAGYCKRSAEQ